MCTLAHLFYGLALSFVTIYENNMTFFDTDENEKVPKAPFFLWRFYI